MITPRPGIPPPSPLDEDGFEPPPKPDPGFGGWAVARAELTNTPIPGAVFCPFCGGFGGAGVGEGPGEDAGGFGNCTGGLAGD